MHSLLIILQNYLNEHGYWTVFAAILLEDFGLPLPGETLLITASFLAAQGHLKLYILLPVAWIAAVVGDNIGYAIGRFGGRRFVERYGHYVFITRGRLEYADSFFERYGGIVVTVARFIEVLRALNGIAAGIAHMRWWRFLAYNALGAALWVTVWGLIAYKLGERAGNIGATMQHLQYLLLFIFIVPGIGLILFALRRHRRKGCGEEARGSKAEGETPSRKEETRGVK